MNHTANEEHEKLNFIEQLVEEDLKTKKHDGRLLTRFPPEPNGYLHIGHAKSICLNFGLALKYGGKTNLRFDDTNPEKEETEYVESIKHDIKWLGFEWSEELYTSDYFEQLYDFAVILIKKGLAYVDDQTAEQMAAHKGTPTEPGTLSKYTRRTVEENLDLFTRMRAGEFAEGEKTLRARIDMTSPNMHLRDPLMYRIKKDHHHRTGDKWCIYPMYDFAHGQSDSIEKITHSICTLEFEVHRPLYDWYIKQLEIYPSQQTEFARLNLNYTVMSKRKLLRLVQDQYVSGWDDPRMPTISAMRRRGFTPEAIRNFCDTIGVARRENVIDFGLLEFCVREHLNKIALRRMVVIDPLKIVIANFEEGKKEILSAENNPEDPEAGNREMIFTKEIFIEHEDFMENPPKKFFRLAPGGYVRLKNAFIIKCDEVIKDDADKVTQLNCTYVPESRSGHDTSGISVKGVLHWVSATENITAEVRLYDRLFTVENPDNQEKEFLHYVNPDSLKIINKAYIEKHFALDSIDSKFQFLRLGYFCFDKDSTPQHLVFNKTVGLKDSWAKISS
ncbi:MAG TPA: glutamine--tRNA ligase/YqeY domain fusion protein [Bacteroidia bacterium]|nr:glutamine--tRNA ligase/YqeY domain fusion protein [Bacteroidia bacterium]